MYISRGMIVAGVGFFCAFRKALAHNYCAGGIVVPAAPGKRIDDIIPAFSPTG